MQFGIASAINFEIINYIQQTSFGEKFKKLGRMECESEHICCLFRPFQMKIFQTVKKSRHLQPRQQDFTPQYIYSKEKMQFNKTKGQAMNSAQQPEPAALVMQKRYNFQKPEGELKNRLWTQEEHVRYIVFLESNRKKIMSKLIRRSNSFFSEMSAFVGGKSGPQCRSHHHKYQLRYKYPHRIIREQRVKVNQDLYHNIKASAFPNISLLECDSKSDTGHNQGPIKTERDGLVTLTIGCQTQIQGVNQLLMHSEHLSQYYKWMTQCAEISQMNHAELMMSWSQPNPYYHLPSYYMNAPY